MTSAEATELFSAAYDAQLDAAEQSAFDAALQNDPELAQQYASFCATVDAISGEPPGPIATPDVLKGVQRRLRAASGGRYYADRFAERSGVGWWSPLVLLVVIIALMGAAFFAFSLLHRVQLTP